MRKVESKSNPDNHDKIEKLSKSQRAELADGLEVLFDLKPEVPEWAMTAKERWEQRIAPVIEAKWRAHDQAILESNIKKYKVPYWADPAGAAGARRDDDDTADDADGGDTDLLTTA